MLSVVDHQSPERVGFLVFTPFAERPEMPIKPSVVESKAEL